jgi:hypothetical protein
VNRLEAENQATPADDQPFMPLSKWRTPLLVPCDLHHVRDRMGA